MEDEMVNRAMIVIAIATAVVGLLVLLVGNFSAAQAGEPMPPRMRRNALILILAGPVCLGSWHLFNGILQGAGYRSVLGYGLAALVFVGGGFMTGLFSRLIARKK